MSSEAESIPEVSGAEQAVLGLILSDDRRWYEIADLLAADDFAWDRHRDIFCAMQKLAAKGKPINKHLLLSQMGLGSSSGVSGYLDGLGHKGREETAGIADYVEALLHESGRYKLILAAEQIAHRAQNARLDTSVEELRQGAQALIEAADKSVNNDTPVLGDLLHQVVSAAQEAVLNGIPAGVRTGFRSFDDLVGPLLPAQLVVIGGETSAGKTALGTQVAYLIAAQGHPVHMTSLEMEGTEIAMRLLAKDADVRSEQIAIGELTDVELERVLDAEGRERAVPLYIDSRPGQNVQTIQTRLARAKATKGIRFGLIDHLQFVSPNNSKARENEQVRQVVDDIKAIAKRLQITIILVSHVSRTVDAWTIRTAKDVRRPLLKDLYGSSAIEKAADAVVFVHRPAWFLERASPGKFKPEHDADMLRWAGKAELILPKRRAGKGHGVQECWFDEQRTWFRDE